jgi:tetratricopeptide (TPR) repeat protein
MRAIPPAALLALMLAATAVAALTEPAPGERVLTLEVVIDAPLAAVWSAWTTEEGLAVVSPQSRVELAPGGEYAWFLQLEPDPAGRRGSEGSRVVGFVPMESLTFDWTFSPATPTLRAQGATTRVVVAFEPVDAGGTRVRLSARGWQEGEEWERGFQYFERAWHWVLQEMKRGLEAEVGPAATSPAGEPPGPREAAPPSSGERGSAAEPAAQTAPEAVSLLGTPLARPPLDAAFAAEQGRLAAEAQGRVAASPDDLEAWIWWRRRTAYLGRFRESIEIYTRALERFPDQPWLLRHRGHRLLTVRDLEAARADLARAAALVAELPDEVEPDGLPNERNLPTSSLHTNVWYHLGLAHYLAGDLAAAAGAYARCLAAARHDDMAVAARYWLALTQARLGEAPGLAANLAAVHDRLDVIESGDYLALLLHFKGEREAAVLLEAARGHGGVAAATVGYGLGAWALIEGDREGAFRAFREVVEGGPWPAFGALAAEAELARGAASGIANP